MKREINRISVVCESISMPLPGQIEQKRYMLNEMKRLLYCTSLTLFKYILAYVIDVYFLFINGNLTMKYLCIFTH